MIGQKKAAPWEGLIYGSKAVPKLLLEEAQAHSELERQASVHRISRTWIILNPLIFIVESFNV